MAACGEIPEQSRPPEAASWGRKGDAGVARHRGCADGNGNDLPVIKSSNCKETLRKVFFAKRQPALKRGDALCNKSINNNEIITVSGSVEGGTRVKARNSYHQDVEEALNSLLWQPYEYQNRKSDAFSSSSSCSSLSSSGLDSTNNGTVQSGNVADLHLLVNNLHVNRLNQSSCFPKTRDAAQQRSGTYLPFSLSRSERCDGAVSRRDYCNEYLYTTGDMRVEIQPNLNGGRQESAVSISTPLETSPAIRNNQSRNALNLSSVNVVGLPNHPRQASVPSSNTTRNSLVPNHSRNTSEPFRTNLNGLVVNHPRNTSEPAPFRPPINNANIVSIGQRFGTPNGTIKNYPIPRSRPNLNISNVNVNYYRAVPVNVVSAVPTIQCLNSTSDARNVSNVTIVQAMPVSTIVNINNVQVATSNSVASLGGNLTSTTTTRTEVIVHSSHDPVQVVSTPQIRSQVSQVPEVRTRTFTSTEAQTDNTAEIATEVNPALREQRRRERRERRHQRRINGGNHRHTTVADNGTQCSERLPDLLNNTLPPPYSTMPSSASSPPALVQQPPPPPVVPANLVVPPGTLVQSMVPNNVVPSGLVPGTMVPYHHPQVPLVQTAGPVPVTVPSPTGFRFPFPSTGFRRSRYSEEPPKSCCGLLAWKPGSLRWFIALIALVAVCCVLVGTALGAMRPSGRDHLTVSLLMIGVGIILVTVSGVAWRLTSHDSSTCRSMLGLGSTDSIEVCPRRFVPRLPPSYGRPHHPYAAMMYPEFQYRPPPPSYQASMQEYRLRLLLLDRANTPQIQPGLQNAVSPPPTYRSHSGSLLRAPLSNRRDASQSEYSCPPSYRSQTSSSRPGTLVQNNSIIHSREHSLSLSESNNGGSTINVVNVLTTNDEEIALDNITLDSLKLEPENDINHLKMLLKDSTAELEGTKDGNLVTIVQRSDQNPVIVTVSGSSHSNNIHITDIPSEMEILAHL